MKILMVACDAGGDLYPATAVAAGLLNRGHDVHIYGEHSALQTLRDINTRKTLAPPELSFSPRLIESLRRARADGAMDEAAVLVGVLDAYSKDQAEAIRRLLLADQRPDLILTPLVGAAIGYRLREMIGAPCCVVNSNYYIGPNPPRPEADDFDARCLPEIAYLAPYVQAADLVLINTTSEFDLDHKGLPSSNHYVGPLVWGEQGQLPDYFREPGNPWSLVTLSSQKQQDIPIARMAIDALSDQPIRLIETIGRAHRRREIGAIPVGAHVEHFVPHQDVLPHCRLVISHAGMCTVMNALWFGVPMVLVPWGRDQPGVAHRAERLGIAVVVPRDALTESRLHEAAARVINDPSIAAAALAHSERVRALRPISYACDLVESI